MGFIECVALFSLAFFISWVVIIGLMIFIGTRKRVVKAIVKWSQRMAELIVEEDEEL